MPQPEYISLPVKEIIPHGEKYFFSLYLKNPGWEYTPGQFVMLRPRSWELDPIWPRPFSICRSGEDGLRIFFRIAGRGTRLISRLMPGEHINVWGPLGNGFDFKAEDELLILAGGMGLAPFMGLMQKHPHPENLRLVFGYTAEKENYPLQEIPEAIPEQTIFRQKTEKDLGRFQEIIRERISRAGERRILACGPSPFLKFIRGKCLQTGTEAQISLENTMACGVGACLGCVQKDGRGGYISTCKNGPVFSINDIRM